MQGVPGTPGPQGPKGFKGERGKTDELLLWKTSAVVLSRHYRIVGLFIYLFVFAKEAGYADMD